MQTLQELRERVPIVEHEVPHAQERQLHQVARPRILQQHPSLRMTVLTL